jgi:hypothetical protein
MLRLRRVSRSLTLCLALVCFRTENAHGQSTNEYQGPVGPPQNLWSDPANWTAPDGVPNETHHVVIPYAAVTVMDLPYSDAWGAKILSLSVAGGGTVDFEGYAGGSVARKLWTVNDLTCAGAVNDCTMNLGVAYVGIQGFAEQATVGTPDADDPTIGNTSGLRWNIEGENHRPQDVGIGTHEGGM